MNNPTLKFTILHQSSPQQPTYKNISINNSDRYTSTWIDFSNTLKQSKSIYIKKEYAPMIIPVTWKGIDSNEKKLLDQFTSKSSSNVLDWYMLPVDIDAILTIEKAKELYKSYSYIGYTTYNHSLKKHKFRLLFPLSKPISNSDFLMRKDAIQDFIGTADSSSLNVSQGFYLPSSNENNYEESSIWVNDGTFIDLNTFEINESKAKAKVSIKNWNIESEIDLSTNFDATLYLKTFIKDELSMLGDHKDCLLLQSILNSFSVPDTDHEDILIGFKRFDSKHNIRSTIKTAKPKFGGLGSMINLFKRFGVFKNFDLQKFKRLSGINTSDTNKSYIGMSQPNCIETHVLSNKIETQIVKEGLLSFENATKFKCVGDILNDSSFVRGINILDAPTNSGKTYLFSHILKRKRILIVPTCSLVEQISSSNNIDKCYEKMPFPKNSQAVVMTYDKIKVFMSLVDAGEIEKQDYDLFVDEAHNIYSSYSYRPITMDAVLKAITHLYFEKVILMSGTLREDFLPKISINKRINISREVPVKQVCNVIHTNSWVDFVLNNINHEDLTLVLINNKIKGESLSNELKNRGVMSQVFNSDNQDNLDNKEMLGNECVKENVNVLIFTSIGVEGLNIKNENIKKIIAVGDHSSASLEQLKNRARVCNPELFLVKNINEKQGYVRSINIEKKLQSAENYINFANGELKNTNKYHRSSLIKQIQINLKSLPSDLSYIIGFDSIENCFFSSNLGLAAYLYDVDCTNESYNYNLFCLHMGNYNFTINKEIIKYENVIDVDAKSKALKNSEIQSKTQIYSTLMSKYIRCNRGLVMLNSSLEDCINCNTDEKIMDFDDLIKIQDLLKKSSILARYYSHTTVLNIMTKYISDQVSFDKALNYAQQVINHSWIRCEFEDHFEVNNIYSPFDLENNFLKIEANNKQYGDVDFNKCRTIIGMSKYLGKLFTINKLRIDNGNGKKVHYKIVSHNPLGPDVEVPTVIDIFPPNLNVQTLSSTVDFNRWIRITDLRLLVHNCCTGRYSDDEAFISTLKDNFQISERCLKSGIRYYKFLSEKKMSSEPESNLSNLHEFKIAA